MKDEHLGLADLKTIQWSGLVILRMLIGWHLLYEGIIKISDPNWTSAAYLDQSHWIFSGLFQAIAASPALLSFVDILNQWILLAAGFMLIAGLWTKAASYTGMVLLLLYYLAQPPLFQTGMVGLSGNSLIVNMVLIEAAALFVLSMFPTGRVLGLDRLIYLMKRK